MGDSLAPSTFFEGKLGLGLLGEAEFRWKELNWTQTWKSRACEPPIFEISSSQLTFSTMSSSWRTQSHPKGPGWGFCTVRANGWNEVSKKKRDSVAQKGPYYQLLAAVRALEIQCGLPSWTACSLGCFPRQSNRFHVVGVRFILQIPFR